MQPPSDPEADGPVLASLPARRVAYREMRGLLEELPLALAHLQAWMEQQGLDPAGDAGVAYYAAPAEPSGAQPRWEVRCPVAPDIPERDPDLTGCGIKALEPATVAVVRHHGPYAEVARTYARLLPWLLENGKVPGWPMEEVFIPDPDAGPASGDEPAFLTEVRAPLGG